MITSKIVGQTKDAGFEIGVRKTFPVLLATAWEILFSETGIKIWLGKTDIPFEENAVFKTDDGITGRVTVLKHLSHTRLQWKKPDWPNTSIVQVKVIGAKDKTTISFHQEKLLNNMQREEMKQYWDNVFGNISSNIQAAILNQ
jgi:hypothetical protein